VTFGDLTGPCWGVLGLPNFENVQFNDGSKSSLKSSQQSHANKAYSGSVWERCEVEAQVSETFRLGDAYIRLNRIHT
jgi:hypothetical protein